jgi:putative component of membrane protein insertase Oxa1/YidC/SpoIIIJ protein YidD
MSGYKINRTISLSQFLFDLFLLTLIRVYQQHISPRKGWRCAYSKLHGGTGCSGFVREAIERHGHRTAFSLARTRFQDCKSAAQTLRLQQHPPFESPGQQQEQERQRRATAPPASSGCDCTPIPDFTDCCWVADAASSGCGPHHAAACDATACHMAACDAGACDAGLGACHCFACW